MADGLNWYRYANNNPIMYSDPTGLSSQCGCSFATPGHSKGCGQGNGGSNTTTPQDNGQNQGSSEGQSSDSGGGGDTSGGSGQSAGSSSSWQHPDGNQLPWLRINYATARSFTFNEFNFIYAVLGQRGNISTLFTGIEHNPLDRAYSVNILGLSRIGIDGGLYRHLLGTNADANLLIHEVFHQVQYATVRGAGFRLLGEQTQYLIYDKSKGKHGDVPYRYGELDMLDKYNVQALGDIKTLEGQAEMVGNYAELYYQDVTVGELSSYDRNRLKRMHGIMGNSGYAHTEAYIYLKRRYGW